MRFEEAALKKCTLLSGQSSVALSFEQPAESIQSTILGALNVLEAIKWVDPSIRLFYPSSSECFGDTGSELISERTRFSPRSPYAVGKASAAMLLNNYREAYNIFVCTGYLFNHESPLRPTRFVTQKIVRGAFEIANGERRKARTWDALDVSRDWGWAPRIRGGDVVDASARVSQQITLSLRVKRTP
jgi:GDPmannose 4,6-dehydratase